MRSPITFHTKVWPAKYQGIMMQHTENTKPVLLVIDDVTDNLMLMNEALRDDYQVQHAESSKDGLRIAFSDNPPDLIFIDVAIPETDGYEICRCLKETPSTKHIPVIFVTAEINSTNEEKGFALGAVDFITKPISPSIVRARVKTHLALKKSTDLSLRKNDPLIQLFTNEVIEDILHYHSSHTLQDVSILAIASLAETNDHNTGNHICRTQNYVKTLAERLQHHPRFAAVLTPANIALLYKSAALHDIGKIHIPQEILNKKGRLSEEEFIVMKQHTTLGRDALNEAGRLCSIDNDFLQFAKEMAHSHHERWDGSGYPLGLTGDEIPISARLMAVADVYDALISQKQYKAAMSHDEAVDIVCAGSGSLFEPEIIDAFIHVQSTFKAIAMRFPD